MVTEIFLIKKSQIFSFLYWLSVLYVLVSVKKYQHQKTISFNYYKLTGNQNGLQKIPVHF